MAICLKNARIVTESAVIRGTLAIEGETIARVEPGGNASAPGDMQQDCEGKYLLPGLFDSHMHGLGFYGVIHGCFNPETLSFTPVDDAIPQILKRLPRFGVTSCLLSSMAAPDAPMEKFLSEAKACRANPDPASARFWGIDLEGNFLKDPVYSGAQDAASTKVPDIDLFEKWQALSGGHIVKALIAPEWGEPAYRLIRHMVSQGLHASVGHTGCTRAEMMKAFECGTRVVVHTGNGPMSQNFKSGGALDAIFDLGPALYAEIIADLKHVHPHWINTFINGFGVDRVIGISDGIHLSGTSLKEGTVIGNTVLRNGALWVAQKADTLAGSVSTLDRQFNNMLNLFTGNRKAYFQTSVPEPLALEAALPRVSRIYSLNPARCFKCDGTIGSLAPGKAADIVVADIQGAPGAYRVAVERVFVAGREV